MKNLAVVATCLVTCFLLCSFQQEAFPSQPKPGQKVATTKEQKSDKGKEPPNSASPGQPSTDATDKNAIAPTGPRQNDKVEVTALHPEVAVKRVNPMGSIRPQHWYASSEWWLVIIATLTGLAIAYQAGEMTRATNVMQGEMTVMQRQVDLMFGQLTAMHEQVTEMSAQTALLGKYVAETKTIADATKKSADATRDSIEMFISKERARLWIDLKRLDLILTPTRALRTVDFTLSLHGTTPASIIEAKCSAGAWPSGLIDEPELMDRVMHKMHADSGFPAFISPNTGPIDCYAFPFMETDEGGDMFPSEVKNDRLFVVIRGFIKYTDVFDRKREFRFRYVWKYSWLEPKDADDRYGTWETCGPDDQNGEIQAN
jgi:hypothetical protein